MANDPRPVVTDHAVLRELERVYGIDVEQVRSSIALKVGPAAALGAVGYVVDGMRYIIRDGFVITVVRGSRSAAAETRQGGGAYE